MNWSKFWYWHLAIFFHSCIDGEDETNNDDSCCECDQKILISFLFLFHFYCYSLYLYKNLTVNQHVLNSQIQ